MNQQFDSAAAKRYISLSNVICIASCISVLYLFKNRVVSLIGGCALIAIILISVCVGIAGIGRRRANITEVLWAVLAIYGAAMVIKNPGGSAVYQWAQMCLLVLIHTILSRMNMKKKSYSELVRSYRIIFWVIIIAYLFIQAMDRMEESKAVVSQTMLKCIVPLSFFVIDFKRRGLLKVLLFAAVCFVLGERASVVVILAIYVFYRILNRWNGGKVWLIIFPVVMLLAIVMPFMYVWMSEQSWRPALDAFAYEYTGQRFFSGRNMLWGIIIDSVRAHWLTGLGFGSSLLLSHDITVSTHNVYMYLYMSGGIMLVALFVVYLANMWYGYYRKRRSETVAKAAAYFLGLIIFMDFELFMIVNNIVVSLLWWITLTVPCNAVSGQRRFGKN